MLGSGHARHWGGTLSGITLVGVGFEMVGLTTMVLAAARVTQNLQVSGTPVSSTDSPVAGVPAVTRSASVFRSLSGITLALGSSFWECLTHVSAAQMRVEAVMTFENYLLAIGPRVCDRVNTTLAPVDRTEIG